MKFSLDDIQAPIAAEMQEFEQKFRQSMQTRVLLLDKIMGYIIKRKGKQLRPMFVFLTAHTVSTSPAGPLPEATFRGAALIELLHTATLVHDDVVDESNYRRGFFSINALWKNKIAVLVGDYLLSRGMALALENDDFELLKIVNNAVRELSEGELLQIEKARRLDITEDVYFDIIRQKTASLIASCTAVGAASAGADKATVERARLFGEKVGMAFQIKDDLFDFGTDEIGKPVGIDIKEKKMTLPLIYALSQASWLKKRRIIYNVQNNDGRADRVQAVIEFVKQSGGLDYAVQRMKQYRDEALEILHTFPASPARTSLQQLIDYTIEREK
ncbi:polyprenyl synthetase family protein [Hymenobacter busanensis]|uniref:Polyprenyl synthetase family protein n=1 Tax=Hymenobacter busanensis TaxID=2607656 RepID=A0A7L4ZW69_9BACT|nr:polyprenyl synthetase family protein [Hymenobacter busanensis]KAA9339132.1 polyprenyl synthetase family protein [Hymenobacter busanensis]QHJ07106.1 polyprenyl synthetase family protein [Hymenobacter busanensis]